VQQQVLGGAFECVQQVFLRAGRLNYIFGHSRLPEPVGNISHVTQGRREIALEDIGVKVADLSAAHRLDEILMVTAAAAYFELPDFLIVVVVCPAK